MSSLGEEHDSHRARHHQWTMKCPMIHTSTMIPSTNAIVRNMTLPFYAARISGRASLFLRRVFRSLAGGLCRIGYFFGRRLLRPHRLAALPLQGLVGRPTGTALKPVPPSQAAPAKRPQVLWNASRSALSWSLCVSTRPWGSPQTEPGAHVHSSQAGISP